jgi:hypothetical protein
MTRGEMYWRDVRLERERIERTVSSTCVYITSDMDDEITGFKSGVTVQAIPEIAARCIVSRTHRVATDAEIAQFHADQKRRQAELEAAARKGEIKVPLTLATKKVLGRD